MTELRIVPDVLPIAPVVFTDAGYYWRGAAAYANDLFEAFDNMIRVQCDPETIISVVKERLESIESDFFETPVLGILREDDEEDLILEDTDVVTLVKIWTEAYDMSINDDRTIDDGSYYHMLNHSMNFFADWEENFHNAVDDTFMMICENGVDVSEETEKYYFTKVREDMSAVLLKDFSEYIYTNGNKTSEVMPFMFYNLKIDARNFAQRQKERNETAMNENGEEIITDLRELNPRPKQGQSILRVLRPE